MNGLNYLIFAEYDFGRAVGPALTAALVPIVLGFLFRTAQKESSGASNSRTVEYPRATRVLVMLGWAFTVGIALVAGFTARGADVKHAALLICLFVALVLPLHIEAFVVVIAWDDSSIHTRSPWRRRRTIPFSAVRSCD